MVSAGRIESRNLSPEKRIKASRAIYKCKPLQLQVMNFEVKNGMEEMRIVHFVVEELLAKGLYYFQPDI